MTIKLSLAATILLCLSSAAQAQTSILQIASGYLSNNGSIDPGLIDADFSGGTAYRNPNAAIDTTGVSTDFYPAVYHNERNGVFTYTLPGLTVGQYYTLNLHFAEIAFTLPNQRQFNVLINSTTYLSNFDIVAEAGGPNRAIVKTYTVTPNASGQIVISFTTGAYSMPKLSGLEVFTLGSVSSGAASASAAVLSLK